LLKKYPPFGTTNIVSNRHLYLVLVKLTTISPSNDIPIFWKNHETELLNKIQNLKNDIEKQQTHNTNLKAKLQKIQDYYLTNCPEIKPPDTGEEQGTTWKPGIVSGNARKGMNHPQRSQMGPTYDGPDAGPAGAQPSTSTALVPYTGNSDTEMIDRTPPLSQVTVIPPDPDNADVKVKELLDIFSEESEEVLKIALRHCNWDTHRAVDEMLDPELKRRHIEEAMERRKQDNLAKSKPAQELSPN